MIKGSIEERMEYEDYILSLKDTIRFPFLSIYQESQKITRYYWIKKTKENREFESNEIQILHLMSLISTAVRIGGLIYTWWWEEYIPEMIFALPQSKADWFVPVEDMAKTFMDIPTKTVEAALLKAKAPRDVIHNSLKAQREDNIDALIEQLSVIPIDEIFGAFKLVNAYNQQSQAFSQISLFDKYTERKTLYSVVDAFETLNPEGSAYARTLSDKVSELAKSIELDDQGVINNPELCIFSICIGVQLASEVFKDNLGSSDPIAKVMQEITEESSFQKIYNRYVQFPRDAERCMAFCRKLIHWMNDDLGIDISANDLDIETSNSGNIRSIISSNTKRLDFPTRFINETAPSQIYAQEREPILTEIFKIYGSYFENMSCEDFLYLFGATSKIPLTYNPPYYWSGDESTLKAILRVLYIRQPRLLKQLILHVSDKEKGATGHDWGKNKDKVAYANIEETIISIVARLTGKTLKRL